MRNEAIVLLCVSLKLESTISQNDVSVSVSDGHGEQHENSNVQLMLRLKGYLVSVQPTSPNQNTYVSSSSLLIYSRRAVLQKLIIIRHFK